MPVDPETGEDIPYQGGPDNKGFANLGEWWKAVRGPTGVQPPPVAPSPAGEMNLFGDEMPIQGGITPTWQPPGVTEAIQGDLTDEIGPAFSDPFRPAGAVPIPAAPAPERVTTGPRPPGMTAEQAVRPYVRGLGRWRPGDPPRRGAETPTPAQISNVPAHARGGAVASGVNLPTATPGGPSQIRGTRPGDADDSSPLMEFFASALQSGDQGQIMQVLSSLPDFLRESILGPLIPGGAINRSNVPAAPLSESERQLTPGASAPGAGSPF